MLTIEYDRLDVRPRHLVLDIGCGRGRHSYEALLRGARVVAIDLKIEDLQEVAEGFGAFAEVGGAGTGGAVVADGLRLPFPDATFDRTIVSEVLEHVPRDSDAMREIGRVTKPGGVVAVSVPRWWPETICWALSREYRDAEGGHVRIYRTRELVARLRAAGLEPVARHHAHALHAPYWWLSCALGSNGSEPLPVRVYRRFLEWQIVNKPPLVDLVERSLDPVLGKSLVLYLVKPEAQDAPP